MNIVAISCRTNTGEMAEIPVQELFSMAPEFSVTASGSVPKSNGKKYIASGITVDDNGVIAFSKYNGPGSVTGTPQGLIAFDANGRLVTIPLQQTPNKSFSTTENSTTTTGTENIIPVYTDNNGTLGDSTITKDGTNYSVGGQSAFFKWEVQDGSVNIIQNSTTEAAVSNGYRINGKLILSYNPVTNELTIGNTVYQTTNIQYIKTDTIQFNTSASATTMVPGLLRWNDTDGTLEFGMKGGNVTQQIGQELPVLVKHADNSGLANGTVVYVVGSDGSNKTVRYAKADAESTSSKTFGIMTESAAGGTKAFCTTFGLVRDLDTSLLTEGSAVYVSPTTAGAMTSTKPSAPYHMVQVGFCIRSHATQGSIFVKIQNGFEINEIHDIAIGTLANNDLLAYDSATSLWKNKTFTDLGLATTETAWMQGGNAVASEQALGTTTNFNVPIIVDSVPVAVANAKGFSLPQIQEGVLFEGSRDFLLTGIDLADSTKQLIKVTNAQAVAALAIENNKLYWSRSGNAATAQTIFGTTEGNFDIQVLRNNIEVGKWRTGGLTVPTLISSNLTANKIPKHSSTGLVDSLIFDNGTNVGIGTSNPSDRLHIVGGNLLFNTNTSNGIKYNGGYALSVIRVGVDASYSTLKMDGNNGQAVTFAVDNNNASAFKSFNIVFGSTNVFNIINNGNVGIGTTNPLNKFHVASGDIGIDLNRKIILRALDAAASYLTYTTDFTERTRLIASYGVYIGSTGLDGITLKVGGNVGIGTTNPTQKLTVAGNIMSTEGGTAALPKITLSASTTTGIYTPFANGWAVSTNGVSRFVINDVGSVGIGTTSLTGVNLSITKNITGATAGYGIENNGVIQSDVTSSVRMYRSIPQVVASTIGSPFTLPLLAHFGAYQSTIGANSTVTSQYGFLVDSSLVGAVNNYGFYGNIASGTNRWNTYNAGTAQNYFRGNVGIGSGGSVPTTELDVYGTSRTTNLKITSGATVGKYWVCTNADGTGAWTTVADSYLGTWNANTNTPTIANGTGTNGQWYRVVVAGTWNSITFAVGDDVKYNGSTWQRIPGQGYTLQTASASVLGGVKVGTGLAIDAGTGVLSVSYGTTSITAAVGNHTHAFTDLTSHPTTATGYGLVLVDTDIPSITASKISDFTTASRAAITENVTGLEFVSGVLNLTNGYFIPTTTEQATWDAKQAALISGTNIKTVGTDSILGSGDISLASLNYWTKSGTDLSYSGGFVSVQELKVNAFKIQSTGSTANSWYIINDNTSGNLSFTLSDVNDEFGTPFSIYADSTTGLIDLQLPVDVSIGRLKDSYGSLGTNKKVFVAETGGTNKWVSLDTSYISDLSTYTVFDSRYYTETESDSRFVLLSGSYSNPSWINNIDWLKLVSKPTTLIGYGITDAYTKVEVDTKISGTTNYLTKFKTANSVSNSSIKENTGGYPDFATNSVEIGNLFKFHIDASISNYSGLVFGKENGELKIKGSHQYGVVDNLQIDGLNLKLQTSNTNRVIISDSYFDILNTLKFNGSTGTSGQFAKTLGTSTIWAALTTGDISNLSSFTGFVNTTTDQTGIVGNKQFLGAVTSSKIKLNAIGTPTHDWEIQNVKSGTQNYLGIYNASEDSEIFSIYSTGEVGFGKVLMGGGSYEDIIESANINGNIRYTGLLKPAGNAGATDKFLTSNGTVDSWEYISTSQIIGMANYTTQTQLAARVPIDLAYVDAFTILGNNTASVGAVQELSGNAVLEIISKTANIGQGLFANNSGVAEFMDLEILPPTLGNGRIAVGDEQNYISETDSLFYINNQLKVTDESNVSKFLSLGFNSANGEAVISASNATLRLSYSDLILNSLQGSTTRYLTVDASGKIGATTSSGGGTVQGLNDVLGVSNSGVNKSIKLKTATSHGYELWNNSDFYRGSLALDVATDTVSLIAPKLNIQTGSGKIVIDAEDGSDIEISKPSAGSFIVLNGTKFSFLEDLLYQGSNTWGSSNNQATPQEGDVINFKFSGGKFVMNKI